VLGHSRAMSSNSQAAQNLGLHQPGHGMSLVVPSSYTLSGLGGFGKFATSFPLLVSLGSSDQTFSPSSFSFLFNPREYPTCPAIRQASRLVDECNFISSGPSRQPAKHEAAGAHVTAAWPPS
jgi:hypothetical protein